MASRRQALQISTLLTGLSIGGQSSLADEVTVFKLSSGVKYVDLQEGTGPTPQYGQLVSVNYKAYIKLPANSLQKPTQPQMFDQQEGYLWKHGNGRIVAGLDEGIHTMRQGGTRRILIPPKLGYIDSGLGPIPSYPWDRNKLNKLLDEMVAMSGGTLIFEVTLRTVLDDEADQGYYSDTSLTPEEFNELRQNIQKKAAAARGA